MLVDMGIDAKAIATRLGHTSVRAVMDVYGHLYPGTDKAIADQIEARLADSLADGVSLRPVG